LTALSALQDHAIVVRLSLAEEFAAISRLCHGLRPGRPAAAGPGRVPAGGSGARDHDDHIGAAAAGDEGLAAGEYPVVAVADCGGMPYRCPVGASAGGRPSERPRAARHTIAGRRSAHSAGHTDHRTRAARPRLSVRRPLQKADVNSLTAAPNSAADAAPSGCVAPRDMTFTSPFAMEIHMPRRSCGSSVPVALISGAPSGCDIGGLAQSSSRMLWPCSNGS